MDDARRAVKDRLQKLLIDATYSYVGHLKAAAEYQKRHQRLAILGAITGFIAGGSMLTSLANVLPAIPPVWFQLIGIVAGTTAGICGILLAYLGYNQAAAGHAVAGHGYRSLTRKCQRYLTQIDNPKVATDLMFAQADALADEQSLYGATARDIPQWAYERARKAIVAGEATYEDVDYQQILGWHAATPTPPQP